MSNNEWLKYWDDWHNGLDGYAPKEPERKSGELRCGYADPVQMSNVPKQKMRDGYNIHKEKDALMRTAKFATNTLPFCNFGGIYATILIMQENGYWVASLWCPYCGGLV